MLPEFYHKCISKVVTAKQYATLRIIVLILQSYRTIQIEKLASILPVPIKYQSRRRHIQRFLVLPQLTTLLAKLTKEEYSRMYFANKSHQLFLFLLIVKTNIQ
jgi:hypothetical protein